MHNFELKILTGQWKEFQSEDFTFGTLVIFPNGNSKISSLGKFPYYTNDWKPTLPNKIYGNFIENFSGKNYTIILINPLRHEGTYSDTSNYSIEFQYTLICDKRIKVDNAEFNCIMLSSLNFQQKVINNNIVHDITSGNPSITINDSPPINIFEDENQKTYLYWRVNFPLFKSNEATIKNSAWLNIKYKNSINLDKVLKEKYKVEQFLTILCKKAVTFDQIEIKHTSNKIFKLHGVKIQKNEGVNSNFLSFLKGNTQVSYNTWLDLTNKIGFALKTFHKSYVSENIALENKFLSICFSLELLHREFFKLKENLKERNHSITSQISEILKGKGHLETWFEKIISSKKEIKFYNRIIDLIEDSHLHEKSIINHEEFAKRIASTRNKYVHLDDEIENPFSETELNDKINILIEIYFFQILKRINLNNEL